MNNITRFEPFNELARFDPFFNLDDVSNRFMMRPLLRGDMDFEPQIKLDLSEANGNYPVKADIPGVSKARFGLNTTTVYSN